MTTEPLKKEDIRYKETNWSYKPYGNYTQPNIKLEKLKSAVGCLKEKVKKDQTEKGSFSDNRDVMNWIDYCFGDVIDIK